jgi:hypothetical protein
MVHWRPAGSAPPDATMDIVNATDEPGVALPDETDIVTFCAFAQLAVRRVTPSHNAHRITEMRPRLSRKSEFFACT